MINPFEEQIEQFAQELSSSGNTKFLQLFLTDYSNLFVAKVISITSDDMSKIAPSYYKEKGLDVEKWFMISDIRELARNDFECVRDNYLANFTVNGHTYAVYGNAYVYPLIIDTKQDVSYFDDESKFYPDVYKSTEFLEIKQNLLWSKFDKSNVPRQHRKHHISRDRVS